MDYFGYDESDFIPCEVCGRKAVDIHHIIYRSQMGGDVIDNLMALCGDCHSAAHSEYFERDFLRNVHAGKLRANENS